MPRAPGDRATREATSIHGAILCGTETNDGFSWATMAHQVLERSPIAVKAPATFALANRCTIHQRPAGYPSGKTARRRVDIPA
jgi:hypothetical protein